MEDSRGRLGGIGERVARRALRQRGYRLLATNWRGRSGEIDIVATCGEVLCFVEVKTRSLDSPVPAAEEVTLRKQRRLTRAAAEFVARYSLADRPCRFDLVTVVIDRCGHALADVTPNAFPAAGPFG